MTISSALDLRWLAHRVAITGWTCALLLIFRTATRPSLLNLGGVWVHLSTSSFISRRAEASRLFWRISFGSEALRRAVHAVITSYVLVRRAIQLVLAFCRSMEFDAYVR
jgi:hypothetical protein